MSDTISRTIVTALGDTVRTTVTFADGKLAREDIVIEGPPELVSFVMSNHHGKNWDNRESKPQREIWLSESRTSW